MCVALLLSIPCATAASTIASRNQEKNAVPEAHNAVAAGIWFVLTETGSPIRLRTSYPSSSTSSATEAGSLTPPRLSIQALLKLCHGHAAEHAYQQLSGERFPHARHAEDLASLVRVTREDDHIGSARGPDVVADGELNGTSSVTEVVR
ncbi:hypothetical protein VTG60DRAFT_707 [Thermothelomyces hinnuleus]